MKKSLLFPAILVIAGLISCNNNTKKEEKETPPPPSEQKEGTTIKVNDKGASVESNEGSNKNNVHISKDSVSMEISKPK